MPTMQPRPLEDLCAKLGSEWPAIQKAEAAAAKKLKTLAAAFAGELSDDVSLVAYGSLARREWTQGSDLDWSLLIDGQYDPEHSKAVSAVRTKLKDFRGPGREGLFGSTAISHDIVERIGGEADTNRNTTQRILLLSESIAIGPEPAYQRVRRQIVNRYVASDRGLMHGSSSGPKVPRFLLNDIVRYWRTVTVDYAYKERERGGEKWALRQFKLAMSRKLIFASGLAACFLFQTPDVRSDLLAKRSEVACARLLELFALTPLDLLALLCSEVQAPIDLAQKLVGAYDQFLAFLDDPQKRNGLAELTYDEADGSSLFEECRNIRRPFHAALMELFFDSKDLRDFTRYYGVF